MTTATKEPETTQAPPDDDPQEETKGVLPFPEREDVEEEAPSEEYSPPEPTDDELQLADDVFRNLDDRAHEMSAQKVIDGLIQLVDVHKQFVTPELFQARDEDDDPYHGASVVSEIARLICRGCEKIEVPYTKVAFVFKDHEKWTSAGQTVEAKVKRFDGFHQYMHEGLVAAVIVNYHHWKTLNPRQKTFVVYHALRELDSKGKRRAPDWGGYFEEPGLFGAGVHREMVTMARAFVKDAPDASEAYQLSILDEVYED